MKFRRLAIRLLIVLGVIAIGFLILFWRIVRVGAIENPPCHACSAIYASAQSPIPTVTLCDLLRNSAQYNDRLVRVHALLKQDSDYVSLTDSSLPCASGSFVYSGFQEPFASCDGARKLLTIYTGYDPQGHPYDGVANVVMLAGGVSSKMPDNLTAKPVCLFFAWKPLLRLATRLFIAGGTLNFESYSAVSNNAYNKSLDASPDASGCFVR